MYLYFDTEFTGLHKHTSLISIGLVAENGKRFYAEFTEYEQDQCDDWIIENVLKHTILKKNEALAKKLGEDPDTTVVIGNGDAIRDELDEWLRQFYEVQLVSDACHYDMVLFIDIWGDAFKIPKNVSAVCHDINQDIATYYGISERDAFDKSREEIILDLYGRCIPGNKHNSLYDALVIEAIYKKLN